MAPTEIARGTLTAPPDTGTTTTILFGTDFSPASEGAFRKAVELARETQARLVIAHVYAPPSRLGLDGTVTSPLFYEDMEQRLRREAQKELDVVLARARAAGVEVEGVLLCGGAVEELTNFARERRAAWLVVGTHGRSGLAKLLAGSVASSVIALAPCPVVTVR